MKRALLLCLLLSLPAVPSSAQKISALPAASSAASANEFEINEAGASKKVTGAQIKTFVLGNSSTVGQVLRVTGASTYDWGALNLADTDAVTGVLPVANLATGTPDGTKFVRDDGTLAVPSGAGGAPSGATYIVKIADAGLTAEQSLASLSTGLMKVTTGTGNVTSVISGTGVETFLATPSSANLAAAVTGESGSGALLFGTSPTVATPTISGAITFPDDITQLFNPGTNDAGLNVGLIAGDPVTPVNGDLWYDSTAHELTAYVNGSAVALNVAGAGDAVSVEGAAANGADFQNGSQIIWGLNTTPTPDELTASVAAGAIGPTEINQAANYAWTGTHTFGTGGAGLIVIPEGTAPGAGASAGQHNLYVDSADSLLKSHENGGSVVTYVRTIASGAKALATGAIASAACTTAQTATATGTATTDVVAASFNGDPTAVTGYVPLTTGMLTVIAYPTANTVNFKVCNNTASSITPGAITLNWRVNR